ncbi:MAG: ATP-dependent zinc metalloprotease FtsH [Thermoleophilia bacterium]
MAELRKRTRPDKSSESPPWRVEGERDGAGDGKTPPNGRGRTPRLPGGRRLWWFVLAVLALNIVLGQLIPSNEERRLEVPYTFFREQVQAGNVTEVSGRNDVIQGEFARAVTFEGEGPEKRFETVRPAFAQDDGELLELLIDEDVEVNARPIEEGRSVLLTLLISFGPFLLILALIFYFIRRSSGGGGMLALGRSKAKRYDDTSQRVSFDDVAGIDEVEDELREIVDFLKNPDRYRKLGVSFPKGVLLSGPPGTGKTLLARAVAGEADVPFFSLSASEFVEMVVGVGASRVRDLFETAKKAAPAIIFIDELDAIGRARGGGGGFGGGNDEREQTLNQILTEMDGFTGSEGVIVLAATNRPEILDKALLRPGRFDRRLTVNPPDRDGREQILQIHTRSVPMADDVDLGRIASTTPGMVGADLRNLINEGALIAARRKRTQVTQADLADALERIVLGAERRITLSAEERERTAYHEAGHAVLGMLEPGADPVRKVSIVPRGRALGVTFQSPSADRYGYDARYLEGRIVGTLGGRAAEELVYGNVTTGAENDLEQVTAIARQMVGRWGMSDVIGLVSVIPPPGEDGEYGAHGPLSVSDDTRELVDREVRRIVEGCYERARRMLEANRERLESLTQALLEKETLDQDDAYRAAGWEPGCAPGDSAPDGLPGEEDAPPTPAAEVPSGS